MSNAILMFIFLDERILCSRWLILYGCHMYAVANFFFYENRQIKLNDLSSLLRTLYNVNWFVVMVCFCFFSAQWPCVYQSWSPPVRTRMFWEDSAVMCAACVGDALLFWTTSLSIWSSTKMRRIATSARRTSPTWTRWPCTWKLPIPSTIYSVNAARCTWGDI